MPRLIFAPMAVDGNGGRPFLERLPQRVDSAHRDGHGLRDARASALLNSRIVRWQ